MRLRLLRLWNRLRASYWFVPAALTAASALLALGVVDFERSALGRNLVTATLLRHVGPEGARAILATLAGSMVTLAGVTFSITIVALTVASSQFGARLLSSFMRDTGNQVSLGTFIATFTFSLLVLRRVGDIGGSAFVPQLALTVAMILGVISLGVLIYFIDHVSRSIDARQVIAVAGREADEAIAAAFPAAEEQTEEKESDVAKLIEQTSTGALIAAERSGYVEMVDIASLLAAATELDLLVELRWRVGQFVVEGEPLLRVVPAPIGGGDERLAASVAISTRRPDRGDALAAIQQIVEIGVRALSPGVNDPFTASNCVEQLGASLRPLAERSPSVRLRRDAEGTPRIILPPSPIGELVGAAFDQLRHYGRGTLIVPLTLLETLTALAAHARHPDFRAALAEQVEQTHQASREPLTLAADRRRLDEGYRIAQRVIGGDLEAAQETP